MTAADFQAAGLYDPGARNAAERLELLEWLVAQGATLDDLREAQRRWGALSGVAGDLALRSGQRLTLAEIAARSGLSVEEIVRINLAAGFPPPEGDQATLDAETAVTFATWAAGAALFGEAAMLHFMRVLGSSLARVAEAAVSLFLANVEAPIVERHAGELALAQANLRAVQSLDTIPSVVRTMLRSHMEVAIRRLRVVRPDRRTADTVRVTVGFVDLVGYTRLTQQLDAHELGALVQRFEALASDIATARDGRVVKLVGDAVMFVTSSAGAACDIALALLERFADDPTVTPRGGLAAGHLLARGGDYYGPAANLASRAGELAVPREILVTAEVAEAGGDRFRFEPAGRRVLKGFEAPVALYAVSRR
ncbi:MAG TPA: adenylate cyclase regulatory domain-containing protein [Candidatus Binatia bacterium]|nr:adenylate cyclase regulatory domain-containing protein [Candidatus Binatia bacterium]